MGISQDLLALLLSQICSIILRRLSIKKSKLNILTFLAFAYNLGPETLPKKKTKCPFLRGQKRSDCIPNGNHKKRLPKKESFKRFGPGGIRTHDQRIMSPLRYRCATSPSGIFLFNFQFCFLLVSCVSFCATFPLLERQSVFLVGRVPQAQVAYFYSIFNSVFACVLLFVARVLKPSNSILSFKYFFSSKLFFKP